MTPFFLFSDVEIHLITYGGENQWPSHVTVGGKLTFKGKAPNLKFSVTPKPKPLPAVFGVSPDYLEIVDGIIHDLHLAFGQNLEARTYSEAINYPFRVHAVKSVIVVNSKPCEVGKFSVVSTRHTSNVVEL